MVHVPVFSSADSMRKQLASAVRRIRLSDLILRWVQLKGRVLCGAVGINMILPENLKMFIKEDSNPVLEVLSPDAAADAKDLRSQLSAEGYPSAEMAASPLTDVRSLMVEGARVVEFTPVPPELYGRLAKAALRGESDARVAPVAYLRMIMLYDLSRPDRSPTWDATFDTLLRLDRAFPVSDASAVAPQPENDYDLKVLLKQTRAWLTRQPYIMCGYAAAAIALGQDRADARIGRASTCLDVLASDPEAAAQELLDQLRTHVDSRRITEKVIKASRLVPRGVTVSVDGRPLVGVYHADQCFAFVKIDGIRVATMDTLLALYLRAFLDGKKTDNIRALCDLLLQQQYRNLNSDEPSFKRFVTDCYGLTQR